MVSYHYHIIIKVGAIKKYGAVEKCKKYLETHEDDLCTIFLLGRYK